MKAYILLTFGLLVLPVNATLASSDAINALMKTYTSQGVGSASIEQGRQLWLKTFPGKSSQNRRSCTSCHTEDLSASGKHIRTGKTIKPMAQSSNPKRLSDAKKIEKWFKRNCKWTMNRECTAQEKANFLAYLSNQSNF